MNTKHSQSGMTTIGWLIILGLVGFFSLLALRLIPVYLEYYTVEKSLVSLTKEPGVDTWSKEDIKSRLEKHLTINQVTRIDLKKDLKIERDEKSGMRKVTIKYDVATPIAGNLEALAHFNKTVELPDVK